MRKTLCSNALTDCYDKSSVIRNLVIFPRQGDTTGDTPESTNSLVRFVVPQQRSLCDGLSLQFCSIFTYRTVYKSQKTSRRRYRSVD